MPGLRHRRDFLKATAKTVALGATVPYWFSGQAALTQGYQAKNDRPLVGCVGCGSRGETVRGTAKEVPDLTGEAGIAPGDTKRNGVMFIGEKGKIFVNRGGVSGVGAEEAKQRKTGVDGNEMHMKNFFDCVKSRQEPLCPVRTAARVITACLLANMAIRSDRKLT